MADAEIVGQNKQLENELSWLAKVHLKQASDYIRRANEQATLGDALAASNLWYLANLCMQDAAQASREAGQVSVGGARDGLIPTFTLGNEIGPIHK